MSDESERVAEELKSLRAEVIRLSARSDALFSALAVVSIQGRISLDQLNNLMKGVSAHQVNKNLGRIADTNPRLATDLSQKILPKEDSGPAQS
jgi:hypothetical protein